MASTGPKVYRHLLTMAKTRAQKVRAVNQDELRVFISERNSVKQIIDNIEEIEKLDVSDSNFAKSLQKYKVANEQRLRLLTKYLPDMKEEHAEITDLPPVVIKLTNATDSTAV